jgi:hypothetical protein
VRAVFIGGSPRSGTTLLGSMLGAHSDCLCVPESRFKITALSACDSAQGTMDLSRILDAIRKDWRFQLWDVDISAARVSGAPGGGSYVALIEEIVRRYADWTGKPAWRLWVDHTPSNVRYAATLFDAFPDARMIHMVRDGRAVAASLLPLDWGPNRIDRAAHHWVEGVGQGLAAEARWGASRVARVRYEDLVQDPEGTLERLCAWLEIDYQARMLNADGFSVPEYTRSQHQLVGKAPDPERVSAWRRALSPRQIEIFESVVGDFLRYLGYAPVYGVRARPMSSWELAHQWLADMLRRQLVNPARQGLRRRRGRGRPSRRDAAPG